MQKFYNFEFSLKVSESNQKSFFESLKNFKQAINKKENSPVYVGIFRNVEDKSLLTLTFGFTSEENYKLWKNEISQDKKNFFNDFLKKHSTRIVFNEQIIFD